MVILIVIVVLCGVAFLAGVPLNGYVLFVAGCRVERTVSAMWFWNRAMSDFIFIIFLPLRFIYSFIFDFDCTWRLSSTVTSFHMFSSAFFLTALSVDRCILVARLEWAQKLRTHALAFGVVMGLWALCLGFSLRYSDLSDYLLLLPRIRMNFHPVAGREIHLLSPIKTHLLSPVVTQFLAGFLIPLALILIPTFYIVLTAKLRRNRLIQSTKPLKILLGLIPTFFLCWLPYHVFFFLQISDMYPRPLLDIGSVFACVLTYFSSCLNPIFYLTMEEEFLRYRQCARNPQTTDNSGREPDE